MGVAVTRRLAEPAERVDCVAGKLEPPRGRAFEMFFENFSKFQSWHAGTQLWHAAGSQLSERGSARFYFHFIEREGVQGTPAVALRKTRHVF